MEEVGPENEFSQRLCPGGVRAKTIIGLSRPDREMI